MNNKIIEERKKIRERVEEILSNHEENTSEGAIYWEEEWVGGKKVPDGHGGYRIDGGERVSTGEAFHKELVHFIESEKKKSYEKGREDGEGRGYSRGFDAANMYSERLKNVRAVQKN